MEINIKLLNDLAKVPTRGSDHAAGYDLYAATDKKINIGPHTTTKIPTGIATELPEGYFAAVFPRSGIATKEGLRLANCVAVIDEDYRGEWFIPIHNDTDTVKTITPSERIAQAILLPYLTLEFNEVDELYNTERGDGGFGSTGAD